VCATKCPLIGNGFVYTWRCLSPSPSLSLSLSHSRPQRSCRWRALADREDDEFLAALLASSAAPLDTAAAQREPAGERGG